MLGKNVYDEEMVHTLMGLDFAATYISDDNTLII